MTSIAHTLFFFVIALIILIAVHEYGHYWAARKLGVKVLRFSLGFGKIIWRYQKSPRDTEFTLSALPLGGYIKMADEKEGEVAPEDLPHAFNRQSLPVRSAIVIAGPLFNFLLAILVYWFAFMWGDTGMRPLVGPVKSGTLASQAGFRDGDEIVAVDGETVPIWHEAIGRIMEKALDESSMAITVADQGGERRELQLAVPREVIENPKILHQRLGLQPWQPALPPVVDKIIPKSAAEAAGMQPGDLIISAEGTAIADWKQWVELVRSRPEQPIITVIDRAGARMTLTLVPQAVNRGDERIGQIGAAVRMPEDIGSSLQVEYRLDPLPALAAAATKTGEYSLLTLKMIGRMITGEASVDNLSGPISIAQYAGKSASYGFVAFMQFLAMVSVSLGVLNLLPIPVLDGGHLLFYLAEGIKGRPLSDQAQMYFQHVGMFVLICLMLFASYMDLGRLFGS